VDARSSSTAMLPAITTASPATGTTPLGHEAGLDQGLNVLGSVDTCSTEAHTRVCEDACEPGGAPSTAAGKQTKKRLRGGRPSRNDGWA
jgi:hypothetical protein